MGYQHDTVQDFCKSVSESYSFDGQVYGLDCISNGAAVKQVSPRQLSDSDRFKRCELDARLEEEPGKSVVLRVNDPHEIYSQVLTGDGAVYATSHPPKGLHGSFVFAPKKKELSEQDLLRLLRVA